MRLGYIVIFIGCLSIVGVSIYLIPDSTQLEYAASRPKPSENPSAEAVKEKQKRLEDAISKEGLLPELVSELADSYVAQGETEEAILLMENYRLKYPADIQMLDKLGIIYHVAGLEDEYIRVLEAQNELMPSVNICYILQAHYSRKYGETQHPEKTVRVLRHLIKLLPEDTQNYKNLIFFLFKANQGAEVIAVVKQFRERFPNQVDYGFIFPLVDQLIVQKMYDEAYREAEPWVKAQPDLALKDFTTMFVNAGQYDYAARLLEGQEAAIATDPYLLLVSVKARVEQHPTRAYTDASRWMTSHPDDKTMLKDLGNLFFAANRFDEVVELYIPYNPAVMADSDLLDIFREALQHTVKNRPHHRPYLIAIYEQELKNPLTSKERKKSVMLAMIDLGGYAAVLPYAREYAFAYRGDWVLLYENLLERAGDKRTLSQFRIQYVHANKLTKQERAYYKSIFMQDENKAELLSLMWEDAQGKSAKSQEVRDLLYIWGLDPRPDRVAWIESRARQTTGEEQLEWLRILESMGAYENMVRVVAAVPDEQRSLPLIEGYFNTLNIIKMDDVSHEEISIGIENATAEDYLVFYANQAKQHGHFDLAARAYEKLIGLRPDNIEYMKERGMMAYYMDDIEAATACLNAYYEAGGVDILAVFYFAELLQQRNTVQAKPLFEQTLMLMEKAESLTPQEEVYRVHTLVRLHRYEEARTEIAKLLQKDPSNAYLRLDNVELHIDMGEYETAENLLAEPVPPKLDIEPLFQMWRIDSKDIHHIANRPLPNEVLLVYSRPIKKLPHVNQQVKYHPEWIQQFSPGYDTVLVSAAWGHTLAVRVEGDSLIFESQKIVEPANKAAESVLYIRRQLLHARIEQETHETAKAIARLEKLHEQYPDDLGTVTGLAIANRAYGRRLQALDLAEKAHMIDPENRWVNILIADLKKPDTPYMRFDYLWLHTDVTDQLTTRLSGFTPTSRNFRIGAHVENDFYSFEKLRLSNGLIGGDSGSAQRAQFDGIYESEEGPIYTASLLVNPDASAGARLHVVGKNKLGQGEAFAEYAHPEWRFVERIPDNAKRDRIGVIQTYSPQPEVFSLAGLSLTNYSQDNQSDATQSVSFYGNIHAPIEVLIEDWPYIPLVVGYGLDAEYVLNAKYGLDPFGNRYRMYPLISREVHVVDAAYRHPFDEITIGELIGSLAYDRMSSLGGPSLTGILTRDLNKEWEMQVRASYGISFTQQAGSGIASTGGYLIRKF